MELEHILCLPTEAMLQRYKLWFLTQTNCIYSYAIFWSLWDNYLAAVSEELTEEILCGVNTKESFSNLAFNI